MLVVCVIIVVFMYVYNISYQELMEVFDDLFDETRIDQWNNLAQVRMSFINRA